MLHFLLEMQSRYSPAEKVKSFYLAKAEGFKNETQVLYKLIKKGKNKKQIQQQFLKTRWAYKQIEIFAEYFFPFMQEN